jgi:hypothetical protein
MPVSTDADLLIKAFKIEDKGSPVGLWLYYDTEKEILRTTRVNANIAYLGDFLRPPMTPSEIFVRQTYNMTLSFSTDFVLGGYTTVVSKERGTLPSSLTSNNIFVYYKPPKLSDVFTFTLYSRDNSSNKIVVLPITISPVDVVPTSIEYNPTINTRNNKYENLTMLFSEGGATGGILTTSSPDSSVSNVSFFDGKCKFDYTTPGSTGSDNIIFTKIIAADIQYENKAQYLFPITNLLEQPNFSNWVYTPSSQSFPYTNTDSLIAVFNKDIKTCTSITATSGSPTTIVPTSITGKQVKFEWTSLQTGSVRFTFNGLTSVDGSIDANVDGDTFVGDINLYTPPTIVGWNGTQPTEPNTLYNLSVTFNKQLLNSRTPVITASDVSPVFTGVTGSQVNFNVTTSSSPSTTIYSVKNVAALDGSIRNIYASISAGAKINSVEVETDLNSSFLTMSTLVIGRTQKVKIILSKAISGVLSLESNPNCIFGNVEMIDPSTAQFTILPNQNTSLTIHTNNIITQDGSQSILSYTFNLISGQTIVNLFESSHKHIVKTTFDVGTTVALSLEMSKPIASDLTGTSITSSSGTVTSLTSSTISGKYYYDFNFTPTVGGIDKSLYVNGAKDLNNFKYTISLSGLTFLNPYVFPTAFNLFSTSNGFRDGAYLKEFTSSPLILTFTGGDNVSQISYVKYTQDNVENTINPNLLVISSTSNTITINSITPTSSNELILKVELKSPNGLALSNQITNTITSDKFEQPPNAIMTTSGLALWLDGADPLANGSAPLDNTDITKWWDRSGNGRHAITATTLKPKFNSRVKNGRGVINFSSPSWGGDTSNLISTFSNNSFPSSAYTIFIVLNGIGLGTVLNGYKGTDLISYQWGGLNIGPGGNGSVSPLPNTIGITGTASYNPNGPAYNIANTWAVATMLINGTSIKSFINSLPMVPSSGSTPAFTQLYIGSSIYNSVYSFFTGNLGEIVIFNSALSDSTRTTIERDLGVKWATFPYNVSPLWNVADWTPTKAFGDEFYAFKASTVSTNVNYSTDWGTSAYWQWINSTYDTSLMLDNGRGDTLDNVHINMRTNGKLAYLLNNPTNNDYYDMKSHINDIWAIRWGYKNAQKPTHIGLGCQFFGGNPDARYTLTGFATSDFTNGTILATLTGDAYELQSCKWNSLTVIDSFKYFEFRQIVGPFMSGIGQIIRLGRGNLEDTSGLGSVGKSNLVCWIDGSDPYVTGQEVEDGTSLLKIFDKSNNKRHASQYSQNFDHSMAYSNPITRGTTKGSITMLRPGINHGRVYFPPRQFPIDAYTICMFCKATPTSGTSMILASGNNADIGWFMGCWGGKFQVTNKSQIASMNTKRIDDSYVTFPFNTWVFMCMVSVNNTVIPYINGVRLKTITNSAPVIQISDDERRQYLHLFGPAGDNYIAYGSLGEFGVYNRALTDSEISTLTTNISTKFNVTLAPITN